MRYLTDDDTIFNHEHEADTYNSICDCGKELIDFLMTAGKFDEMTEKEQTDFNRYLYKTMEDSDFNHKQ